MIRRRALAMLAFALLLSACSSGGRGDAPAPPRPLGLRWEQFPDIPMPSGWLPLTGMDHVAIAIANRTVRRLSVALQAPAARADLQPPEAMTRYVGGPLTDNGWTRVGEGRLSDTDQQWIKGAEKLHVEAKRVDGLVVIRWRLSALGASPPRP